MVRSRNPSPVFLWRQDATRVCRLCGVPFGGAVSGRSPASRLSQQRAKASFSPARCKVPVLRNWGKKVVVVIDRFFYDKMNALADAYPRARNDQKRRDNSDVVWFVVDYDQALKMAASVVVFTSLESSRRALNATEPLSKADFTRNLKQVIHDNSRANKVFKASE